MKKWIAILLAAVLLLLPAGCQSQEAALRQWEAENDLRKAYYEASAAYAANASGRSSSGRKSSSSNVS